MLLSFFFFFFTINLYFSIPAVIPQIFILTGERKIPSGIATKEANADFKTQPVTVETKINKCLT